MKRICAYPGCGTFLRRSNKGKFCGIHENYEPLVAAKAISRKKNKSESTKKDTKMIQDMKSIPFDELGQFWWPGAKYDIERNPKKPSDSLIRLAKPTTKKDLNLRWYEPVKDRTLPLKLAKVNEYDEADILKFVNEYGLLGQNQGKLHHGGETLAFFQGEVRAIRHLVNLYGAVQEGEEALQSIIEVECGKGAGLLLSKDYVKYEINSGGVTSVYFAEKSQFKGKNQLRQVANRVLADRIIEGMKLHGPHPSVRFTQEGNPDPISSFSSLIGAIYFQLYTAITKRWKYRRCGEFEKCGNLFIPQRADNNFCSDRCRSRYYTRKSRTNRKEVKAR